jgi:hypothetical protein
MAGSNNWSVRCAAKTAERQLSHSCISVVGQLGAVGGISAASSREYQTAPCQARDMRGIR